MNGTVVESNAPPLGFLLHEVARLLRRRFEQNARGSGLTRSQWQVLAYLAKNEGINQSGLADLLEIEPITLGRIVDKLQTLALIERRPHPSELVLNQSVEGIENDGAQGVLTSSVRPLAHTRPLPAGM